MSWLRDISTGNKIISRLLWQMLSRGNRWFDVEKKCDAMGRLGTAKRWKSKRLAHSHEVSKPIFNQYVYVHYSNKIFQNVTYNQLLWNGLTWNLPGLFLHQLGCSQSVDTPSVRDLLTIHGDVECLARLSLLHLRLPNKLQAKKAALQNHHNLHKSDFGEKFTLSVFLSITWTE